MDSLTFIVEMVVGIRLFCLRKQDGTIITSVFDVMTDQLPAGSMVLCTC